MIMRPKMGCISWFEVKLNENRALRLGVALRAAQLKASKKGNLLCERVCDANFASFTYPPPSCSVKGLLLGFGDLCVVAGNAPGVLPRKVLLNRSSQT